MPGSAARGVAELGRYGIDECVNKKLIRIGA